MFFLIFTFFIMLAVNMEGEYNVSSIVLIVSLILILAYIAHIILLTIAVGKSAGKRCMSSDWIWALLTFIFGLPVAIVFAIFIIGIESNKNKKRKQQPCSYCSDIVYAACRLYNRINRNRHVHRILHLISFLRGIYIL